MFFKKNERVSFLNKGIQIKLADNTSSKSKEYDKYDGSILEFVNL